MADLLDSIEDTEMARMLEVWIQRLIQDDDYSADLRATASRMQWPAGRLHQLIKEEVQ